MLPADTCATGSEDKAQLDRIIAEEMAHVCVLQQALTADQPNG